MTYRRPSPRATATRSIPLALSLALAVALPATPGALAAQAAAAIDAPLVPLDTRWPSITGVAMFAPERVNATTVEATSDGWVRITALDLGSWARDFYPMTRLQVRAADALAWADRVRRLTTPGDSANDASIMRVLPKLGRGRNHVYVYVEPNLRPQDRVNFQMFGCGNGAASYNVNVATLRQIADMVERAARMAMDASPTPGAPTLRRPYYPGEVGCPVLPDSTNARPRFPAGLRDAERRYTEVGVRFVVDTSGAVERESVATLPGAEARIDAAARALVRTWRYTPAEWGGRPVRQVVTTTVAFDPEMLEHGPPTFRVGPYGAEYPRVMARPGRDGWVHLRHGTWRTQGTFDGYEEWVAPDAVDEWVRRMRPFLDSVATQRRPKPGPPRMTAAYTLGYANGGKLILWYPNGWAPGDTLLRLDALVTGCNGGGRAAEPADTQFLARLASAARTARRSRATPEPVADRVFAAGEVACQAHVPPIRVRQEGFPGYWRYPLRVPAPPSMEAAHARAEVMASVVVDTTGVADVRTLVAMAGSDPRAVAALRAHLPSVRFRPAQRSGVKVRQRTIRTWLVEPVMRCVDEDAGPECPRDYDAGP
jgi:TonB family protein